MRVAVAFDTSRLQQDLRREQQRVVSTSRRAIYELAHRSVAEIREGMRTTFDRPTRWTLNSVYVEPLRAQNSATVSWKPGTADGRSAGKYLRWQIEGGRRTSKAFERLFALRPGYSIVPGKWAELDAHGNMNPGQLTQILSYLRLFREVGFTANRPKRLRNRRANARSRVEYFIRPLGATRATHPQTWHLPPGVYRVAKEMGGASLLVLAFVRAAQYRPRFSPERIVTQTVARDAAQVWDLALRRQLPFRR